MAVSDRQADRVPPPPELDALREAGVPTVPDEAFAQSLEDLEDRRRGLLGLVESDARDWSLSEDS